MQRLLTQLIRSESGATAIEYSVIAALISIAAIAGMSLIGNKVGTSLNNAASHL